MKRVKYIMYLGILLALLAGCNETLEDTYSDYAGDGKIRYVGKARLAPFEGRLGKQHGYYG